MFVWVVNFRFRSLRNDRTSRMGRVYLHVACLASTIAPLWNV
jgi:hypothetical protein